MLGKAAKVSIDSIETQQEEVKSTEVDCSQEEDELAEDWDNLSPADKVNRIREIFGRNVVK